MLQAFFYQEKTRGRTLQQNAPRHRHPPAQKSRPAHSGVTPWPEPPGQGVPTGGTRPWELTLAQPRTAHLSEEVDSPARELPRDFSVGRLGPSGACSPWCLHNFTQTGDRGHRLPARPQHSAAQTGAASPRAPLPPSRRQAKPGPATYRGTEISAAQRGAPITRGLRVGGPGRAAEGREGRALRYIKPPLRLSPTPPPPHPPLPDWLKRAAIRIPPYYAARSLATPM